MIKEAFYLGLTSKYNVTNGEVASSRFREICSVPALTSFKGSSRNSEQRTSFQEWNDSGSGKEQLMNKKDIQLLQLPPQ
jgi:hypothetical protein